MRRILLASVIVLLPLSARAAEPGNRATLTPKEIADGWILLFDGQTTFGWTSPNDSKWTIANGMLAPQTGKPGLLVTTTVWSDYDLSLEIRVSNPKTFRVLLSTDAEGRNDDQRLALPSSGAPSGTWFRLHLHCEYGWLFFYRTERLGLFGRRVFLESSQMSKELPGQGHIALSGN